MATLTVKVKFEGTDDMEDAKFLSNEINMLIETMKDEETMPKNAETMFELEEDFV